MNQELPLPSETCEPERLTGIVLSVQANYYWVRLDQATPLVAQDFLQSQDSPRSQDPLLLLCTRRTRLKKIGQQVMVGDRVLVENPDWQDKRGAIAQVFPRRSQLDRPPIANADHILLVFAIAEPALDPFQLSRFLVKAESTGLQVTLALNKCDLVSQADQQQWSDRLQTWGYQPILISVQQKQGLSSLYVSLGGKTTVVSGPSGVGKSSLINILIPDVELRTGSVSGKLGRGRHTTRHVELFELPGGGLLADSPGFNQPDLTCSPSELARYFPEARHRLERDVCQFSNCLHLEEPGCVVRGDWERYDYYRVFLEEAIAHQEALNRQSDAEPTTKQKVRSAGRIEAEPILQTKKYRRPSRRTEKQALQELYHDIDHLDEEHE